MAKISKSTGKKSKTSRTANAEQDVLCCLLRKGKATSREIMEAMSSYRPMALGSVDTLLTRLGAKGMVSREKGPVGKAFIFKANQKPEPIYRNLMKDMSVRVFGGDTLAMASAFFETASPTSEEANEIKRMAGSVKARKGRK